MNKYFIFILIGLLFCESQNLFKEYIGLFKTENPPIYINGSKKIKTGEIIDTLKYKDFLFNGEIGIKFPDNFKVIPVITFAIEIGDNPKRTGAIINSYNKEHNFYHLLIYNNNKIEDIMSIAYSTVNGNTRVVQDSKILKDRLVLINKINMEKKIYKFSCNYYDRFYFELIDP